MDVGRVEKARPLPHRMAIWASSSYRSGAAHRQHADQLVA